MRFISELIEKKKAGEPGAPHHDAKAHMTGGLAMHDATRRRPASLIDETLQMSRRRRDTGGWGADPDELADSLEGGPEPAGSFRLRNGYNRVVETVRSAEMPRRLSDAAEHTFRPSGQDGEPDDAAPEQAEDQTAVAGDGHPDVTDAPMDTAPDDVAGEPSAELDEAARVERNLNLAFETPLEAVTEHCEPDTLTDGAVEDAAESDVETAPAMATDTETEMAGDPAWGAIAEPMAEDHPALNEPAAEWVGPNAWDRPLEDLAADEMPEALVEEAADAGVEDTVEEPASPSFRVWDLDDDPEDSTTVEDDPVADTDEVEAAAPWAAAARDALVAATSEPTPEAAAFAAVPPVVPAAEPAQDAGERPRAGRVKTRLLGFHRPDELETDPFAAPKRAGAAAAAHFPVGWLVVVQGPGRGAGHALFEGVSTIGRADDQTVPLDYGDTSISRENHAAIAYDEEQNGFFIGHGGKANLVRLNGMPVLSTEPLSNGDQIRIGETTLRFVALCGSEFSWGDDNGAGARDAATL